MNIVLEGPDGGGKSTLAAQLQQHLGGWRIQESEGPPHYENEINDRIERYLQFEDTIFDRHPIVSQTIYSMLRDDDQLPASALVTAFYEEGHVFIYIPSKDLSQHVLGVHDSPSHLEAIEKNWEQLQAYYDQWAVQHANLIYRQGDDLVPVIQYISGALYGKT